MADNPATSPVGEGIMVGVIACSNCGNFLLKGERYRCSQCKQVFYCDNKCQKEDWKRHKHTCRNSITTIPPEATDPADMFSRDATTWIDIHHETLNSILKDICPDDQLLTLPCMSLEYIPNIEDKGRCFRVICAELVDRDEIKLALGDHPVCDEIESELRISKRTNRACFMIVMILNTPDGYTEMRRTYTETFRLPSGKPIVNTLEVSEWFARLKSILEDGVIREDGWGTRRMIHASDIECYYDPKVQALRGV